MITNQMENSDDSAIADLAVDLTPMLDILFILLVFFLLTAGTVLRSLDLELPRSVADDIAPIDAPKHVMLQVKLDGFSVGEQKFGDLATLKEALPGIFQAHPGHKLIIASDRRVEADRLLGVLTMLQSTGILAANILLSREDNP